MMNTERFRQRAERLAVFCRERGYNSNVVLLWDLSLHSGRRRFVVWSVAKGRAEHCFVCSHGSGSEKSRVRSAYAECSNAECSHLSSIGRAVIAERYEGHYGVAYRMDGLDDSNSALRERCIVLHGWRYTTLFPIYPLPTVGSWGCPVLSQKAMRVVDDILQREQRVVLWAFK